MNTAGLVSLKDAAVRLGKSVSGLRKDVSNGRIRFYQARKNSPIKFRPEWLEEHIDAGTREKVKCNPLAKQKRRPGHLVESERNSHWVS